mmetsp:Transcript_60964/g.171828  ORF Transcript_60964/g.171828 Transcript_60964/m.171828 type:complete len:300 (-) Transcript_60964:667-1566(-)
MVRFMAAHLSLRLSVHRAPSDGHRVAAARRVPRGVNRSPHHGSAAAVREAGLLRGVIDHSGCRVAVVVDVRSTQVHGRRRAPGSLAVLVRRALDGRPPRVLHLVVHCDKQAAEPVLVVQQLHCALKAVRPRHRDLLHRRPRAVHAPSGVHRGVGISGGAEGPGCQGGSLAGELLLERARRIREGPAAPLLRAMRAARRGLPCGFLLLLPLLLLMLPLPLLLLLPLVARRGPFSQFLLMLLLLLPLLLLLLPLLLPLLLLRFLLLLPLLLLLLLLLLLWRLLMPLPRRLLLLPFPLVLLG